VAFLENLRAENVLAVGYRFVQGVQNGQAMGIYAVEEGFAKELLESQQRREGVIVRYNEDLLWQYWAAYDNDQITPRGVNDFHIIDEFESGKVAASPALTAQREVAIGQLRAWENGDLTASEVFDIEALAKFLALSDLWGAPNTPSTGTTCGSTTTPSPPGWNRSPSTRSPSKAAPRWIGPA
jgi:hypothetical protein